jgi:hypothetical protein
MRTFILSVCVATALAVLAGLLLGLEKKTAYQTFATEGARVGDPGHNLVGRDWSGLNKS